MTSLDIDMKMRILLAAKKLFAKQGYEGTSVRQICEEAGANIALISYHFGGKEKVFYELFRQFFPIDKLVEYKEVLSDPYQGLKFMIEQIIELRAKDPELITILQLEIILRSPRENIILEYASPVWRKIRELLELGRSKGIYHFESLDSTLLFVLGAILFYKQRDFFEFLFTEEKPSKEQLIEQTAQFVLNGLRYND
jgi:AcrR family transcriptional regulator